MAWYDPRSWLPNRRDEDLEEKLNPAQAMISREQGVFVNTDSMLAYNQAFERLETVNRGVNMIVSACASMDYDIKEKALTGVVSSVKKKGLQTLLNFTPNPYQSIQEFRCNIFTDFILEGNIFIYYDGVYLYHLPASRVTIQTDPKTFIKEYTYNRTIVFKPDEIIHVKDLSSLSIYRGTSRLQSADRNIKILYKMQQFQDQFFENGAVMGLILTSDNTLSNAAKERTIMNWIMKYSPKNGARKPIILDSGLKPAPIMQSTFKDMDFDTSIRTHNEKILNSLGIPPILFDGGNNANIGPNLRLFYLETILPIVTRYVSAMERYFGYDISPVTDSVSALQPDEKDVAAYLTTLVNGGVLTPNEARVDLRYEPIAGHDDLRIPANIAGSAANPSLGGAPKKEPNPAGTPPKEPPKGSSN